MPGKPVLSGFITENFGHVFDSVAKPRKKRKFFHDRNPHRAYLKKHMVVFVRSFDKRFPPRVRSSQLHKRPAFTFDKELLPAVAVFIPVALITLIAAFFCVVCWAFFALKSDSARATTLIVSTFFARKMVTELAMTAMHLAIVRASFPSGGSTVVAFTNVLLALVLSKMSACVAASALGG